MFRVATIVAVCALLLLATEAKKPKWFELEGYTFKHFTADFRRRYQPDSAEYKHRENVFNANLKIIQTHNKAGTSSYKKGVNQFTDMTDAEFKAYNRAYISGNRPKPDVLHTVGDSRDPLPRTVDYRVANPRILTAIKNQGACGDCWAHSSVESMEAHFALKTGQLPVLSTQQITSCTTSVDGCGGGDAVMGWLYVNSTTDGLTSEWAYPFVDIFAPNMTKESTAPCKDINKEFPKHFDWFNDLTQVGITGYGSVSPNNQNEAAMAGIAHVGPMSISVAALNWKDYESGVYQNSDANGGNNEWGIDHAVQMVGYGHDGDLNKDYWIVRNSWGTLWGEDGYIRLDRPNPAPCSPDGFVCGTSGCLNGLNYPLVKEMPTKHF